MKRKKKAKNNSKRIKKKQEKRPNRRRKPLKCMQLIKQISDNRRAEGTKRSRLGKVRRKIKKETKVKPRRGRSAKKPKAERKGRAKKRCMSERKPKRTPARGRLANASRNQQLDRVKEETPAEKMILGLVDLIPVKRERVARVKPDKSGGYTGAGEEIQEESQEESVASEQQNPNLLGFHDLMKTFVPLASDEEKDFEDEGDLRESEGEGEERSRAMSTAEKPAFTFMELMNINHMESESGDAEKEDVYLVDDERSQQSGPKSQSQRENEIELKAETQDIKCENDSIDLENTETFVELNAKRTPSSVHENKSQMADLGDCKNAIEIENNNEMESQDKAMSIERNEILKIEDDSPISGGCLNQRNPGQDIPKQDLQRDTEIQIEGDQLQHDKEEMDKENQQQISSTPNQDLKNENVNEKNPIKEQHNEKIRIETEHEDDNQMRDEGPKPEPAKPVEAVEDQKNRRNSAKKASAIREESPEKPRVTRLNLKKHCISRIAPNLGSSDDASQHTRAILSANIRSAVLGLRPRASVPTSTINLITSSSFKRPRPVSMREKYQDLLSAKPQMPLSSSLNRLFTKFKLLASQVNLLASNRITPFFSVLRTSIVKNYRTVLQLRDLQQMLHVLKFCFDVHWAFNSKIDDYDLIVNLSANAKRTHSRALDQHLMRQAREGLQQSENRNLNAPNQRRSLTRAELTELVSAFRKKLINLVSVYHNKFLDEQGVSGSSFQGEFARSWHSQFDLESVTNSQVQTVPLPAKPKKVSMEEIRRENLQKVLGSSARQQISQINHEIDNLRDKYLEELETRQNAFIFNEFERDKFQISSTNDEGSVSGQPSLECNRKNSTMASASASQNYIGQTLKWKSRLGLRGEEGGEKHFVERSEMRMAEGTHSKFKKLQSSIHRLVGHNGRSGRKRK